MKKLTIEDIESYTQIHKDSANPMLEFYKQLADTMRENERFRKALERLSEYGENPYDRIAAHEALNPQKHEDLENE